MIEMIKNEYILQGYEMGRAQGEWHGELKGRICDIITFLLARFNRISSEIVIELNRRTDPIALESLVEFAAQCDSLDEFADALK